MIWKNCRKAVLIALAVILLGASFSGGVWYGKAGRPASERVFNVSGQKQTEQFSNVDFNLFWDVWSRLEDKFVDKKKIDRKKLVNGAISGLVGSLKDPYTEFFPPAESKQFAQDIKG